MVVEEGRRTGVLTIADRDQRGWVHVTVAGEVDGATVAVLEATLSAALTSRPPPAEVCVDLGDVRFFSAAGVTCLLAARRQAADRDITFLVVNATGVTARVLRAVQVDAVLSTPVG